MSLVNQNGQGLRLKAVDMTESKSGAKTVLIVEDNELNMKLFHDLSRCAWL